MRLNTFSLTQHPEKFSSIKFRKNKSVCLNHDIPIVYFTAFNQQNGGRQNTNFERIMLSSVLSIAMAPIEFIDHFELSVLLMYY